jgi:hypothetical protein
MERKLILLEFNELCPPLLDQWMAEGLLPNFKAFYDRSEIHITAPDEPAAPFLEPWIQWYSIHTGLSYKEHQVFHLTDGPKANHPDVWSILLANGKRVANCSSMNAKSFSAPGSFFLPDPWCTAEQASPEELQRFHSVVAHAVQQYSNTDHSLSLGDYTRFLTFLALHGLRMKTAIAILQQLCLDRVLDTHETWRRAVLLDMLQFDVFRWYFRKYQPHFSTFFLNSTAHYQHSYWRYMQPDAFEVQPSEEERKRYGGAILFGYQCMDRLVGEFVKLESYGVTVALATALSQQAFLKREGSGGQHFYRPRDVHSMLKTLGIHPREVHPVMSHQYVLTFADDVEKERAEQTLKAISHGTKQVFDFADSGARTLFVGCQLFSELDPETHITLADRSTVRFFDWFYSLGVVKSGSHHPDGLLWIKSGNHRVHSRKFPIVDILPMILEFCGVTPQVSAGSQVANRKTHAYGA